MSYKEIETQEMHGYEVVFSYKDGCIDFDIEEVAADELSEAEFDALWKDAEMRAAEIQEEMEVEEEIRQMGINAYRRMIHQMAML